MPLISVKTSSPLSGAASPLLMALSAALASQLGKPERYVMALVEGNVAMTFAGDAAPSCYVEVKSIGALDGDRTRQVSAMVCELIARHLGIPADRIYIGFEDVPGRLWGWNGSTFG